jgi:hypothetical protein
MPNIGHLAQCSQELGSGKYDICSGIQFWAMIIKAWFVLLIPPSILGWYGIASLVL